MNSPRFQFDKSMECYPVSTVLVFNDENSYSSPGAIVVHENNMQVLADFPLYPLGEMEVVYPIMISLLIHCHLFNFVLKVVFY